MSTRSTPLHHKRPVLAIILISYLMIILDVSIVITGLPRIQADLGFSPIGLSWIQSIYLLAFGGLLLLGSRIGDVYGRRRMLIIGLGLFTMASLLIGISQAPWQMIGARALQGAAAAILAPSTLSMLTTQFEVGPERTKAVAYYGSVAGIGASLGLVLGGVLADWLSWRVGFFINLPIGVAMIWGARRYLTETERHQGQFDITGAITSIVGMMLVIYGIVRSGTDGWGDSGTLDSACAGVLILVYFAIHEHRAAQPVMPLRLFASRERTGAYLCRLLFVGAMVGFFFFTTQYLQQAWGYTALQAGIAFLPMTLVNFAAALLVPRLTHRLGNARLLAGGLVVTLIGMAWLGRVSHDTNYWLGVALPMALIGMGQGGAFSPMTAAGIAGVDHRDAGVASGLVNVFHQIGGALGLSVLVAISAASAPSDADAQRLLDHSIETSLTTGAVMLAVALLLVLVLIVRPASDGKVPLGDRAGS